MIGNRLREERLRLESRVSKKATDTDKLDRRHFNDPHRTVRAIGAEAARKGLRVFDCPYSHPAMRASWLKGFAQA
ncbi:CrpP family protein, partial [Pseudomonas aeruginosa]|nr:CrpP family protein [Pseudomonas aeruginosa]MBI8287119.1 CrpP family protein [Pseudomonas aeruginosa]